MIGLLGWPPDSVWPLSYRELTIAYEVKVVSDWDHTSLLAGITNNLTVIVSRLAGSKKVKAAPVNAFHPHRRGQRKEGLRITPSNIGDLRMIGDSLMKGR